jgi:HTH-type transcriptional regulator/antitoxin MqsA
METRYCPSCETPDMVFEQRDIPFDYKGERLMVLQVRGWFCTSCHEAIFDDGEGTRYAAELDRFTKVVDARQREELRRIRRKLHLTQRDAARLFGGGVNAFSEYERGVTKPAKATLVLLRILDKHPDLVDEVRLYA